MRVGQVQMKILKLLWRMGKASAREITEGLNEEGGRSPIAHSTVQTLLRKLESKGAASHRAEGRTFVYFPLVKEEKVTRSATREFLSRVFSGSPEGLISFLLKNERISRDELARIKELIDEKESERK